MSFCRPFGVRRVHEAAGNGETIYRDIVALLADLTAGEAGTVGTMFGADDETRCFELEALNGVGVPGARMSSRRALLWPLDGSEGWDVGTDTTDHIQLLGTVNAPTWGAAGASTGGLILDGSGGMLLRFLGEFSSGGMLAFGGRIVPNVTAAADGQEYVIGRYSPTADKVLSGGVEQISSKIYRQTIYDDPLTPLSLNPALASFEMTAGHEPAACGTAQIATDEASLRGAYLAGSFTDDSVPVATSQRTSAANALSQAGRADMIAWIWTNKAAGTLTARFTEISLLEVLP
jgi:hypothetical protein